MLFMIFFSSFFFLNIFCILHRVRHEKNTTITTNKSPSSAGADNAKDKVVIRSNANTTSATVAAEKNMCIDQVKTKFKNTKRVWYSYNDTGSRCVHWPYNVTVAYTGVPLEMEPRTTVRLGDVREGGSGVFVSVYQV